MLPAAASVITQAISVAVLGEGGLDRGEVVVGQHDRVGGAGAPVTPGVSGSANVATPGAGRGEQRVDVAVVAAGELHDHGAAGEPAGQPDRASSSPRCREGPAAPARPASTRATISSASSTSRSVGRAEREAARGGLARRRPTHLGVGVPEDHRAPGADEVDVLAAVDVGEVRRRGAGRMNRGRAADGAEGAHRRVHPARRSTGQRPAVEPRLASDGTCGRADVAGRSLHGGIRTIRCSAQVVGPPAEPATPATSAAQ